MRIAAILFDKDGTLIDYDKSWSGVNLAAGALAAAGDAALAARLLVAGGADPVTGRARADSLLAAASTGEIASQWSKAGSPVPVMELKDRLDGLFQASVEQAVPVTDLEPLFRRLKNRGLVLGIASSDSELAIRKTAARFGLEPHIDFIAGYDSGYGLKPGGGMVEAFCAATGVLARTVAVVGDNTHDMHMATAGRAGLRIGVLTGTGTPETLLPHCSICLESIADLESILPTAAE